MSLLSFGRFLGAQIMAQNYLDIDIIGSRGAVSSFVPGKNVLFRLVATCSTSGRE